MKYVNYLFVFIFMFFGELKSQIVIPEGVKFYNQYDKKWYHNGKPFTGIVLLDRKGLVSKDSVEHVDGLIQGLLSINNNIYKLRYNWINSCLVDGYVIINNFRGYVKNNKPIGKFLEYYGKGEQFIESNSSNGFLSTSGGITNNSGGITNNTTPQKLKTKIEFIKDTVKYEHYYSSGNIYRSMIYLVDTSFYDRKKFVNENKYYSDWFNVSSTLYYGNWIIGFDFEKFIKMNNGVLLKSTTYYEGKIVYNRAIYEKGMTKTNATYFKNGNLLDSVKNLIPFVDFKPTYLYSSNTGDSIINYEPSECFFHIRYNQSGKILLKTTKLSGRGESGIYYSYFNNGKIERFYTIEDGVGVAPSESYFENGILKTKHFKEGDEYFYIENFPDGNQKIKIKTDYKLDRGRIVGLPLNF